MSVDRMLSDSIRTVRTQFAEHRHGGIVMPSEQVESFVKVLETFVDSAEALEDALAAMAPIDPAGLTKMVSPASATILQMLRPGSNIYRFPGNPNA